MENRGKGGRKKQRRERKKERESSFNFIAADRIVDVASLPSAVLVNPPPPPPLSPPPGKGRVVGLEEKEEDETEAKGGRYLTR